MLQSKKLVFFCLLSLLAMCVFSAPVDDDDDDDDDVELTDEQMEAFVTENMASAEPPIAAIYKWGKTPITHMVQVRYVINVTQYTQDQLDVFREGLADIENKTCIRFINRRNKNNTNLDYIYVRANAFGTCNSKLGRVGGRQILNLSPACMRNKKKCVHELIHALGFRHMHQRYDRDTAIVVQMENVLEDKQKFFKKFNNKWEAYNTPYDPLSCMHYARNAFSKNGENTIVTKNPEYLDLIGKSLTLTDADATRINRMYKCPDPYK